MNWSLNFRHAGRATLMALALFCTFCSAAEAPPAEPAHSASTAQAIATVRERVQPAVVSILVVRQDFSGGEARLSLTSGSGSLVSADGYIATNAHVIENGQRFRVVLNDQREFRAGLVGADPVSDLAVLKLENPEQLQFPFAPFSEDISDLKPGDAVIAMGAPNGLRDSLSVGVLNNTQRLLVSLFEDESDYEQALNEVQRTARYYAWLQHDASISPGNSGGPLMDLNGRVIGVNTRGNLFGGAMAFSIPGPIAAAVVKALIADGTIRRSDFGFGIRSLRGSGLNQGALIATVDRDSAAERSGLRPGDVLEAIDNKDIFISQPEQVPEFRRRLSERQIGSKLQLRVRRAQQVRAVLLTSVEQMDAKPREREIANFGISVGEITTLIAKARFLDSTSGVLITGLRTGGPAATAQPALLIGDRILAVNGTQVRGLAEFARSLEPTHFFRSAQGETLTSSVTLSVERRGQNLLSEIIPAPKRIIAAINPELKKSWAGIEVQPIPATLAPALKLPEAGFRITRIYPAGPAANAGLLVGDLITHVQGLAIRPSGLKETSALDLRVRNALRSEPLEVSVQRLAGGVAKKISVKLSLVDEPLGSDKAPRYWDDTLSVMVRELSFYDRNERKLSAKQKGVLLERIENGGRGGLAFLRDADLLVRLNETEIVDIASFRSALSKAQTQQQKKLEFLVMRGADTRILFVDAPWVSEPTPAAATQP